MNKKQKSILKSIMALFMTLFMILPLFKVEANAVETQTIYYDNSNTKWESVSIYYWGGSTKVDWPGISMEKATDIDRENIYKINIPKDVTNIIFNDGGKGEQSLDINDITDGREYVAVEKEGTKYAVIKKNEDLTIPQPMDDKDPLKMVAEQVNAHIGSDGTNVNLTYTTLTKADTKVIVNKVSDIALKEFTGESEYKYSCQKYFHKVELTGLEPGTKYEYSIGTGDNAVKGSFTTVPAKNSKEPFKFVYLADTQVNNDVDAKALGVTFNEVNNIGNLGFVYFAGDITNNSADENQWMNLFKNNGKFKTAGSDLFRNNLISVVQGNHDASSLTGHITAPSMAGDVVYAYDYGMAKFIMLNLELKNYDEQKAFLEKEVKEAKENGQWTIVGFHKSIYTGASHIVDNDVIAARKFFGPVLADLDVDVVLQGHDHVYSRGFVTKDGANANLTKNEDGTYNKQSNAPLYMVGGHAGGLKWYSQKDYTVQEGDPLTPNYSFLDKNSTNDQSNVKKEQVYTVFEVSNSEITTKTYMLKYDTDKDEITTDKYLYDTVTIKREVKAENLPAENEDNKPADNEQAPEEGVLGAQDVNAETSTGGSKTKTGDNNQLFTLVIITIMAGGAVVYLNRKKKNA